MSQIETEGDIDGQQADGLRFERKEHLRLRDDVERIKLREEKVAGVRAARHIDQRQVQEGNRDKSSALSQPQALGQGHPGAPHIPQYPIATPEIDPFIRPSQRDIGIDGARAACIQEITAHVKTVTRPVPRLIGRNGQSRRIADGFQLRCQ